MDKKLKYIEMDKKKVNIEIEHAFGKLAASKYDVKLGLTVSDKDSGGDSYLVS